MHERRVQVLVVAAGLTLVACGSSEPITSPATDPVPVETEVAGDDAPDQGTDVPVTEAPAPAAAPPTDEAPAASEAPAATEAPAASEAPAATEAPVETDAPPAEAVPAPVGGRAFSTELQPEAQFDANPFPDLVVDDVGRDGQANIANILPSDRPVLLWTWAPH